MATRLDLISLPLPNFADVAQGSKVLADIVDDLHIVGEPMGSYIRRYRNKVASLIHRPYHDSVGRAVPLRRAVKTATHAHDYDVIVASQLFVMSSIPRSMYGQVVFDSHNVESIRLREIAAMRGAAYRAATSSILRRVRKQEQEVIQQTSSTVACSEIDAMIFQGMCSSAHVRVVENGVDVPSEFSLAGKNSRTVLFLASLDYAANIDSLEYLLRDIYPRMRDVKLVVAGSNATRDVLNLMRSAEAEGVEFLGQVDDPGALMRSSDVLVVPLRAGSGTRLKVMEAFALGLPVVSTPKGCEGLPVDDGIHVRLAQSSSHFASCVEGLIDDRDASLFMAANAWRLAKQNYDWSRILPEFRLTLRDAAAS
jgi:glycosyltransferase involved in cell wall biosynthesis